MRFLKAVLIGALIGWALPTGASTLEQIRQQAVLPQMSSQYLVPVQSPSEGFARQIGFDKGVRDVLQNGPVCRRARVADYLLPVVCYASNGDVGVDIGVENCQFREIWADRIHGAALSADSCTNCDSATNADYATTCGSCASATNVDCAALPAFTGDATKTAGSCATVLANIPDAVPVAGFHEWAASSAPSNPAGTVLRLYNSSLNGNMNARNSAGTVYAMARAKSSVSSEFLTAFSVNGTFSSAQPAFSDLSGSATDAQIPDTATILNASNADTCDSIDCATFVVGPGSASNNDVALFDGATGKLAKSGGTFASLMLANDGTGSTLDADTCDGTNCASFGSGSVTSVDGSGGTTGLTLTGGPITTSGTLTLGGTLAIANGGTGNTSGTATINANLTGPITSVGNATSVAAQTGTGSTFVMQASPTLTTPVLGAATGTSLSLVAGAGSISLAQTARVYFNGLVTSPSIRATALAVLRFTSSSGDALDMTTTALSPVTAGGMALGSVALGYGSLFLDEAGAGTQTAQIIAPTLAADAVITTPNATSTLATLALTETLTNKTLGATVIAGDLIPDADVTRNLGDATHYFNSASVDDILCNTVVGESAHGVSTWYLNGSTGRMAAYDSDSRSTEGMGVVPIFSESISATKTANFTAASYTPPATAGRYRVSAVITTTSATNTGTLSVTVDYVDSQGTTHTADLLPILDAGGGWDPNGVIGSVASKEFHAGPLNITINNAATAIVLKVVITGTVSYTVAPLIEQVG